MHFRVYEKSFNFHSLSVGPRTEYLCLIFTCSVKCMHSYIIGSRFYIFECNAFNIFAHIFNYIFSICYRAIFSIYLFHPCSEYEIIARCILRFFVGNSNISALYLYFQNLWFCWCCRSYLEFIRLRLCTENLFAIFITNPGMAICIISTFWQITKLCLHSKLILPYL